MPGYVNVNGTWRNFTPKVNVSGAWRGLNQGCVNINGQWRPWGTPSLNNLDHIEMACIGDGGTFNGFNGFQIRQYNYLYMYHVMKDGQRIPYRTGGNKHNNWAINCTCDLMFVGIDLFRAYSDIVFTGWGSTVSTELNTYNNSVNIPLSSNNITGSQPNYDFLLQVTSFEGGAMAIIPLFETATVSDGNQTISVPVYPA